MATKQSSGALDPAKQYRVDVLRTVTHGRLVLRAGTRPILKGRVIQDLGDAVRVRTE